MLAFEAGCQDYCKGEIIEIEGKAARFTCATLETAQFGDPRAVKVPGPA